MPITTSEKQELIRFLLDLNTTQRHLTFGHGWMNFSGTTQLPNALVINIYDTPTLSCI